MRLKKIVLFTIITAFVLTGLSLSMPEPASAAGWVNVKVDQIGPSKDGNVYIRLTAIDGSFSRIWYILNASQQNKMLAVVLTAMTNDLKLQVYIDSGVAYSEVRNMYMFAPE